MAGSHSFVALGCQQQLLLCVMVLKRSIKVLALEPGHLCVPTTAALRRKQHIDVPVACKHALED